MNFSYQVKTIKALLTALLIIITFSCARTEYTTQHFSFPPGSKPHENNWKFTGLVIVSSNQSPITKKSKKKVTIKITDNKEQLFLEENIMFNSASIRANVDWNNFDYLEIELVETGNKFAKDPYNIKLVKTGPQQLVKLNFKYDKEDKKFKKINEIN